jgi:hypothetical protein
MSAEFRIAVLDAARARRTNVEISGRGIVTCAGGNRLFISVYVLLRVLRETLDCRLPIQVWHFGGEEISPAMHWILSGLKVELVDVTSFLQDYPADIRNGWQLKSYAILQSRFAEVLFLDADQVPVRDPTFLFDAPQYRENGAVFWPDAIDLAASNPIWALVGLPQEACPSWESGQILLDKRRHLAPLQAALHLNEQQSITYRHLHGDKDTFLIAWRVLGAQAAIAPRPLVDSRALIQRDFDGEPLFQHRIGCKWTYGGDQYTQPDFVHMDSCLAFLADLRRSWNGRGFFPPDRSLRARTEEQRLVHLRKLHLILAGDEEFDLDFLPGHQLGNGRSLDRQNWYVVEISEALDLIIHDGDRQTYRLRLNEDGYWIGNKTSLPPTDVKMIEPRSDVPARTCISGLVDAVILASGVGGNSASIAEEGLAITLRLLMRAEPGLRSSLECARHRSGRIGAVIDLVLADRQSAPERIQPKEEVLDAGYQAARHSLNITSFK